MKKIGTFQTAQWGAVDVMQATYGHGDGPIAIVLECDGGERLGVLSVNLPGSSALPEGCFYAKTYFENETLAMEAIASGLFVERVSLPRAQAGRVTVPVWQIVKAAE